MIREKKFYLRVLNVGPGGFRCACCFPRKGTPARVTEIRIAKRKEQRLVDRLVQEELG